MSLGLVNWSRPDVSVCVVELIQCVCGRYVFRDLPHKNVGMVCTCKCV